MSPDRFTIGVDLDGCLARGFLSQYRTWLISRGHNPASLPSAPTGDYDLLTSWDIPRDVFFGEMEAACQAGALYTDCVPDEAGLAALRHLHRDGVGIVVVTARTQPTAEQVTAQWLHTHQVPHDLLICTTAKETVTFDLLVDDSPAHVTRVNKAASNAVLLDRPWNQAATHLPRLPSWESLPDLVAQMDAGRSTTSRASSTDHSPGERL